MDHEASTSFPEFSVKEEKVARERAARTAGWYIALAVQVLLLALAIVFDWFGLDATWSVLSPLLSFAAFHAVARWGGDGKWVAPFLPDVLSAERRRRQAIEAVVDGLEPVVSEYRLEGWFETPQGSVWEKVPPRFREDFKADLVDAVPHKAPPEIWPSVLIDELVRLLPSWPGTAQGTVLRLLDQERRGPVDAALWARIRESDDGSLALLADVLFHSGRLPLCKEGQDWHWEADDLVALLKRQERFAWDRLYARITELNGLAGMAFQYLTFLQKNGLEALPLTMSRLEEICGRPAPSGAPPEASLLTAIGATAIGEALAERNRKQLPVALEPRKSELLDDVTPGMLGRYARLSAVLFLTRSFFDHPAEKHLCWELSQDDEAVRIAWAYLDLKKDLRAGSQLGEKSFLSFSQVIENWRTKLWKSRRRKGFQQEIAALESALHHGTWVVRLEDLLERVEVVRLRTLVKAPPEIVPGVPPADREDLARQAVEQLRLGERPDLLARTLREVDLDTIARHLETERFIPYLITFQARQGPLSQLIDLLTAPKKLAAAGIEIKNPGERRRYNFRPYTDNARIGLVPEGMTFEEFQAGFQEDLAKVLEARDRLLHPDGTKQVPLKAIEVLLHRFSGIGRTHFPFESPFSSHLALSRLKDVLAENLSQEELLTLVQSGVAGDLKAHILGAAIPEILGEKRHLTPAESTALTGQDSQIKQRLLEACQVDSLLEMGRRLAQKEIDHQKAAETLTGLIQTHVPRLSQLQSHDIADHYLEELEVLAA